MAINPSLLPLNTFLWELSNPSPKFSRKGIDETQTGLLTRPTPPASQKENYYEVTPLIAEWACTLSNAPFLIGAWHYGSPELAIAGFASILSHAIPRQIFLTADKIGVVIAFSKLGREYEVVLKHPSVVVAVGFLAVIFCVDVYASRIKGQTLPHVLWHISAAAAACYVLELLPK